MAGLFRYAGDIQFKEEPPVPGQIAKVKLKPHSKTVNLLQYQRPLTPEHPYFFAQISSCAADSNITIGIAGPDIDDGVHPGNWINTVGYQSNSGRCFTSHKLGANTDGQKFGINGVFGVIVTYFGKDMSTVVFIRNGQPVATRYHFESDHSRFLPTIALQNGPIDIGLMWPEASLKVPEYDASDMVNWIRSPLVNYNRAENYFYYDDLSRDELPIQSPFPLSKDTQHFEVIIKEVSPEGAANCIAIATCSPIKPTPTCELLRDYFRWHPDGQALKMKVGQRMGWGILYDPDHRDQPDFDDKAEQLVLCYVSIDSVIVYHKMMVQPQGGWYPLVLLHPYASRVQIDMESNTRPKTFSKLDSLFWKSKEEAGLILADNAVLTQITPSMLRASDSLRIDIGRTACRVHLPAGAKGVHTVQFSEPLTPENSYFFIEVRKASEVAVLSVGLATPDSPMNKFAGRIQHSVGYLSRDGKMYTSDQSEANSAGQRYGRGDCVGVEIDYFEPEASVVLFSKNFRPVGTRFVNIMDLNELHPTVTLFGGGAELEIDIIWQTRICSPPVFQVTNVEHWCLPELAYADTDKNIIHVKPGHTTPVIIQAPYCLNNSYNHFEVKIIDDFDETTPPPAIALGTPSPYFNFKSNFKQDFIRFWAVDEALNAVKKGDTIGWGTLYPADHLNDDDEDYVICYLTINRDVAITRVLVCPPGGFYPVVILPFGVDRVQLEFGATIIKDHPFLNDVINELLKNTRKQIILEQKQLSSGEDLEDWSSQENRSKYLRPVPIKQPLLRLPTALSKESNGKPAQNGSAHKKEQRKPRLEEVESGEWDINDMQTSFYYNVNQKDNGITHFSSHKESKSCTIL